MQRIILTYGLVSGAIVIGSAILGIVMSVDEGFGEHLEWLGYLIMLLALSIIFFGIKRYRDEELGGVITFGTSVLVGLGISAVASVMYVVNWEIYLALTDYAFIDQYADSVIAAKEAAGASAEDLKQTIAEMEQAKRNYARPLFRVLITFTEIFPVGLLITLISAAVL